MADILQCALDSRVAPRRVLHGHAHDQPPNLGEDAAPTRTALRECPLARDQLSVPAEQCVRSHDRGDLAQGTTTQPVRSHSQASPIVIRQAQAPPTQLPAQETVLFDQVGERFPLAALQPTGQDQQEHLDGCRGDHERELISQPAVFARHEARSSCGTERALPTRDHGVCGALSSRTESPRTRQPADHGDARGRRGRPRASALAPGRIAELLRACGVIRESAEMWNRTGLRTECIAFADGPCAHHASAARSHCPVRNVGTCRLDAKGTVSNLACDASDNEGSHRRAYEPPPFASATPLALVRRSRPDWCGRSGRGSAAAWFETPCQHAAESERFAGHLSGCREYRQSPDTCRSTMNAAGSPCGSKSKE
jgi:hypothetical protein